MHSLEPGYIVSNYFMFGPPPKAKRPLVHCWICWLKALQSHCVRPARARVLLRRPVSGFSSAGGATSANLHENKGHNTRHHPTKRGNQ